MAKQVALSELQLDVLRILWERGECSTLDVVEGLRKDRGLAHTTVSTLLTRLEKRGVVTSIRDGRQLLYKARVTESKVRSSMVTGLIYTLFKGDAKALLAHLVDEDEIDAADLERVRKLLKKEPNQ
ncbi:MAG TPA: BlaI/MecI/CopY family transcriptional regulator [Steroidobacteraceae bacterium]|nr:BlaI/MecI/CopY family transcriptional regulator [Steroidobacteraceae bacterium]